MKWLLFKGFYEGMKSFGAKVVDIVNFFLLLLVYFIGVGISSMIAKVSGRKLLNMNKPDKKIKTYWIDKDKRKLKVEDYYRQF